MKFKVLPALILTIICISHTYAQKRQTVYYLKNSGKQVNSKDSADFIRVVSEPDSGSVLYNVNEFYTNGKPKFVGKSLSSIRIQLEGQCLAYFPSGKRQIMVNYKNGQPFGDVYYYYPNGRLYSVKGQADSSNARSSFVIKLCNDSTGKSLAQNGNGYYINYSDDFKRIVDEGPIAAGLKDGDWKLTSVSGADTIVYTETFSKGSFVSGISADKDGRQYPYTMREAEPYFDGGLDAFYKFINSKIRYPASAKDRNIQGRVSISLVIEKDGSFSDIKVQKAPDESLGAEAVRVLKLAPKWHPGVQNGRPVRIAYSMPVTFSLGY